MLWPLDAEGGRRKLRASGQGSLRGAEACKREIPAGELAGIVRPTVGLDPLRQLVDGAEVETECVRRLTFACRDVEKSRLRTCHCVATVTTLRGH